MCVSKIFGILLAFIVGIRAPSFDPRESKVNTYKYCLFQGGMYLAKNSC